jgi:hypothetical protein
MRASFVFVSAVGSLALVGLAILLFDLSLERALLLAPAIVLCMGAAAGLLVLWAKAALEPVRRRRRLP